MLDTIRFVRGAVSDKATGPQPILTHFFIYDGRIQGSDGRVAIDASCPELDISATLNADKFLRAIDICGDKVKLKTTEGGRISITDGRFRATLASHTADYPRNDPSKGKKIKVPPGFIDELRILKPFIGEDATRAWASNIYFHKGNAFAIYNAMLGTILKSVMAELEMSLPLHCMEELIRIGTPPDSMIQDSNSLTFFWGKDRWLKSQLLVDEWPSKTAEELVVSFPKKLQAIPDGFLDAVKKLTPFCRDPDYPIIDFDERGISTEEGDSKAEIIGIKLKSFRSDSRNLIALLEVADEMLVADDGKRAYFKSKENRWLGILAGIHKT